MQNYNKTSMMEYFSKDSTEKIIKSYIDTAFPVKFPPNYHGPKNISYGSNKEMHTAVRIQRKLGFSEQEVLRNIITREPDVELSDEVYAEFLNRYIDVSPRNKECSKREVLALAEEGLEVRDIFRTIVSGYRVVTSIKQNEKSL